ncbi:hypothetical protein DV515_00014374 [Chloebia gouldiae]|uniref:Uncharacterized protein n=1 Tax=Chloebia gouldiae TaxID=44316 RepID=A0A3L8RYI8_CHLGU|nr:hypothetical protein DV515_00014374 [Chloebia gouldiae]
MNGNGDQGVGGSGLGQEFCPVPSPKEDAVTATAKAEPGPGKAPVKPFSSTLPVLPPALHDPPRCPRVPPALPGCSASPGTAAGKEPRRQEPSALTLGEGDALGAAEGRNYSCKIPAGRAGGRARLRSLPAGSGENTAPNGGAALPKPRSSRSTQKKIHSSQVDPAPLSMGRSSSKEQEEHPEEGEESPRSPGTSIPTKFSITSLCSLQDDPEDRGAPVGHGGATGRAGGARGQLGDTA